MPHHFTNLFIGITVVDKLEYNFSTNEEMIKEFEKHLHEQYAANNNAGLSNLIALITSSIVIFGFYGYVFVYSTVKFTTDLNYLYCHCTKLYSLDVLVFITMACLFVINVLIYICFFQGLKQRKEQFVIFALRKKYYQRNPIELSPKIYPETYHPFQKSGLDIVQGLYGEMIKVFQWLEIVLLFSTFCKILINVTEGYSQRSCVSCNGAFEVSLLIVMIFGCIGFYHRLLKKTEIKYHEIEDQYKNLIIA